MKNLKLFHIYESLEACQKIKITDDMVEEAQRFDSDEELLRSGGFSIQTLDRAAHGFSESDIRIIDPQKLKVRWRNDLENVLWEIEQSGLSAEEWSKSVDLSEPIDVDYWEDKEMGFKRGFYIQDGHHRYVAAKTLGKPLKVNLEIKINPIKEISRGLGYDEFHRCVYKRIKSLNM